MTQTARNLVMDLQDAGAGVKYLIRDRDTKFTQALDAVFTGEGIEIVTCSVRTPRMNSIMERWVQTCRRELLDRTLISSQYRSSLELIRDAEPRVRLGWSVPKVRRDPFRSRALRLPVLAAMYTVRVILPTQAARARTR